MENPSSSGNASLFLTVILGIISWFTPQNIDLMLKIVTGTGAFIAAIMTARYQWIAYKVKKEEMKNLKNKFK